MLRVLQGQGKLVLQQVTYLSCMGWLPRNFIQSEVSIDATHNHLKCCKTGLGVGGKTRNMAFSCTFLLHVLP